MASEKLSRASRKAGEFFGLFMMLVVIAGVPSLLLLQLGVSQTFGDDFWNSYTEAIGWLTAMVLIPLLITLLDFLPPKAK